MGWQGIAGLEQDKDKEDSFVRLRTAKWSLWDTNSTWPPNYKSTSLLRGQQLNSGWINVGANITDNRKSGPWKSKLVVTHILTGRGIINLQGQKECQYLMALLGENLSNSKVWNTNEQNPIKPRNHKAAFPGTWIERETGFLVKTLLGSRTPDPTATRQQAAALGNGSDRYRAHCCMERTTSLWNSVRGPLPHL